MRIGSTLPPAAAPLRAVDLWNGIVGMFSGEASLKRIEGELKEFFGVREVFLVSSGKAALALVLRSLGELSRRTEVVIPAYTCYSVPAAVLKAGLKIRLCDIDPRTLDYDFDALDKAVGDRTLCVVTTNLFGRPSDVERIQLACRRHGAYLVEDAAQAMGAERGGKLLGTVGDAGIFSFGRGKNITCGGGGLALTDSEEIGVVMRRLYSDFGSPGLLRSIAEWIKVAAMSVLLDPRLYWVPAGMPFLRLGETVYPRDFALEKLSSIQAGLLRNWKRRLEESNAARRENARRYRFEFPAISLDGVDGVAIRFPVMMTSRLDRDALLRSSAKNGLGISAMYPGPINEIPEIRHLFDMATVFPGARVFAERHVTLPTHSRVTVESRKRIIERVKALLEWNAH